MSNAREFILENSKDHSEAIDNGYCIKMDEPEILEWMEKYAQFKLKNNGDLGDFSVSFSEFVKWARQADLWDGFDNSTLLDDFKEFNEIMKRRALIELK